MRKCVAWLVIICWSLLIQSALAEPAALKSGARSSEAAPITLMVPVALSGPGAITGEELLAGARACIDSVNAAGGVRDRPVALAVIDNPASGQAALDALGRGFERHPQAVAMMLPMNINSALEFIAARQIPVIGPPGGSYEEHSDIFAPGFFHIKQGGIAEYGRIAEQLASVYIHRVAYVLDGAADAAKSSSSQYIMNEFLQRKIDIKVFDLNSDAGNFAALLAASRKFDPQAFVLGVGGGALKGFI